MAVLAFNLGDRSARARTLRPAILLLVLSMHAAFLVLALRWQSRLELRSVDSLMLLALASHEQVAPEAGAGPVLPHEQLELPLDIQLIRIPMPQPLLPAEAPPAPIVNWSAQAELAAQHQAQLAAEPKPRAFDRSAGGMYIIGPGFEAEKPQIDWDRARIHRFEGLEGGGSMLWLNDRCFIVLSGLIPVPICGTGKLTVRGDLFDQLGKPVSGPRSNSLP